MAYERSITDRGAGRSVYGGPAMGVPFMGIAMGRTAGVPPVGIPVGGSPGVPVRGSCGGPMYVCNCVRCYPPSTALTLAPPGTTDEREARYLSDWTALLKQLVPPPTFANYGPGATMYKRDGNSANANFAELQMLFSTAGGPSTSEARSPGSSTAAATPTSDASGPASTKKLKRSRDLTAANQCPPPLEN